MSHSRAANTSILYVMATPIGNLEDITLRAARILRECSLVICEDTRRTLKLMNHLEVAKPLESCHAHTSGGKTRRLAERIGEGASPAVFVTDGGTPGISDPGAMLVRACRELGIPILPVPGASALSAALSVSGFPSNGVFFAGFLPLKPGKKRKALEAALHTSDTLVCFESPYRAATLLRELETLAPNAQVMICREMTKIHEEYIFWQAGDALPELTPKGEKGVRHEYRRNR
jgi:16S rRNA (cytidine1402-2'-O)-methyltransferase